MAEETLGLYNPWMGSSRGHSPQVVVEAVVSFCLEHPQANLSHGLRQSRGCERSTFGVVQAGGGARSWTAGLLGLKNSWWIPELESWTQASRECEVWVYDVHMVVGVGLSERRSSRL